MKVTWLFIHMSIYMHICYKGNWSNCILWHLLSMLVTISVCNISPEALHFGKCGRGRMIVLRRCHTALSSSSSSHFSFSFSLSHTLPLATQGKPKLSFSLSGMNYSSCPWSRQNQVGFRTSKSNCKLSVERKKLRERERERDGKDWNHMVGTSA